MIGASTWLVVPTGEGLRTEALVALGTVTAVPPETLTTGPALDVPGNLNRSGLRRT